MNSDHRQQQQQQQKSHSFCKNNFRNFRLCGMNKPSHSSQLFHGEGLYHIETSPLICKSNQWTGLYMIGISVMKEFMFNVCIPYRVIEKRQA